jgi:predicted RND superfamily exporter protein
MNVFTRFLAAHARLIAVLTLLSAIYPASFLPRLLTDNSVEVWLPQKSPAYRRYQEFTKRYGSDEFIVIAAETDNPFSDESLAIQKRLAAKIRAIPGVDRVWDLASLSNALWPNAPDWKEKARHSAFLHNMILASDENTVGMFVFLQELRGPGSQKACVQRIEAAAHEANAAAFTTHLAGAPRMTAALDDASQHDSKLFLPLAILICVLALSVMMRDFPSVIAPMCAVTASAVWTVGLMVMTGHALNIVTVVMPTLHFVLGLSNRIRLASRFSSNLSRLGDSTDAIRETLNELMAPLFFMSFTMAVGFLSLLSSDLAPIYELGLFSAVGLMIAFLSNVLIVPGVLLALRRTGRRRDTDESTQHWSARTGLLMARRRWTVLGVTLMIIAGCALLMPRLHTESNVLKFFPMDSSVSRDYRFIGDRLSGFYSIELDIQCAQDDAYDLIEAMKKLEHVISKVSGVVRVDHMGRTAEISKLLTNNADNGQQSPFSGLTERFYAEEDGHVSMRMCVLVNVIGSAEFHPLVHSIETDAKELLPSTATWYLTGIVPLLTDSQTALIQTQVQSFSIAFGIIVTMMGLLFWSIRAAIVSILPNLVPILITFAIMAIRNIPLDTATVMIASVAVGISVDNTIYFLARYKAEKRAGHDSDLAISNTFNVIGTPIIFTSIVAAAGFSILAFANFGPIVYFGVLTGVTMLTSLLTALFLTPACVRLIHLWDEK